MAGASDEPDTEAVHAHLLELQDRICAALEEADGRQRFGEERWERESGGGGRSRILREGALFEQAGVGFSRIHGAGLPAAATAHRPDLAGRGFEATGVSVVLHPHNPYVPTSHMNVRFFAAQEAWSGGDTVWWFGGGFDLTPCYPFAADARAWHRQAAAACEQALKTGGRVTV